MVMRISHPRVISMHAAASHLVFHGSVVLLFGLLLGAPYARAIKRNAPPHIVNSWRVAHLSLPIGATLMLSIAGVLPLLSASVRAVWIMAVALIVSAYAFCISTCLAAMTGQRGLQPGGAGLGKLVYLGNLIGACASAIAAACLVAAAFVSL
jgi:hypothetical protein